MLEIIQDKHFNYEDASSVLEWKSRFFTNLYQDGRIFPTYYKINLIGNEFSNEKINVICPLFKKINLYIYSIF